MKGNYIAYFSRAPQMSFAPSEQTMMVPPPASSSSSSSWQQRQDLYGGSPNQEEEAEEGEEKKVQKQKTTEEEEEEEEENGSGCGGAGAGAGADRQRRPPPLCAGCSLRITDSEFLIATRASKEEASAPEGKDGRARRYEGHLPFLRHFHPACLRCAECGADLEKERAFLGDDGAVRCGEHFAAQ